LVQNDGLVFKLEMAFWGLELPLKLFEHPGALGVEILAAVAGVDIGLLFANLDVHRLVLLE
jgi:hypothetical protein